MTPNDMTPLNNPTYADFVESEKLSQSDFANIDKNHAKFKDNDIVSNTQS
jgi:hypothetical protein